MQKPTLSSIPCALAVCLLIGAISFHDLRAATAPLPRTADGKPNLQGIWKANTRAAFDLESHDARLGVPAGRGVVLDGAIPYQPWAAAKRSEHLAGRETLDPLEKCYMPGVPRIVPGLSFIFRAPLQITCSPSGRRSSAHLHGGPAAGRHQLLDGRFA